MLGAAKLVCGAQVAMLSSLFDKRRRTVTETLFQQVMSGNMNFPMDSVVYVKQHDNMHFGIGFKPVLVLNHKQIMKSFDINLFETISDQLCAVVGS